MKKIFAIVAMISLLLLSISACGSGNASANKISVISREDGSGTRGAFVELCDIEQKNESGEKIDYTIDSAEITNSTAVMMTTVAGDPAAIGYISLGSLNDTVKAVQIDGVSPSTDSIKDGSYPIARPFNIATKGELSPVASDFIDFILSADGQTVVEEKGYISMDNTGAYQGVKPAGKIVVAGSSSVTPVMEALKEAYLEVNPSAQIEVQQSDSTTGMNSAKEGICDIGMASRGLKDSELEAGLSPTVIAQDGIAVVVNNENAISTLTKEQVQNIYTGTITDWSELS